MMRPIVEPEECNIQHSNYKSSLGSRVRVGTDSNERVTVLGFHQDRSRISNKTIESILEDPVEYRDTLPKDRYED